MWNQTDRRRIYNAPWFKDKSGLAESLQLWWWNTTKEPLPRSTDTDAWEEVDLYFLEERELETKGWEPFCVCHYSPFELRLIKQWMTRNPRGTWIRSHKGNDIYARLGVADDQSLSLIVRPELMEETKSFLTGLEGLRPMIFEAKTITREIRNLLKGKNYLIVTGELKSAISCELLKPSTVARLTDMCRTESPSQP